MAKTFSCFLIFICSTKLFLVSATNIILDKSHIDTETFSVFMERFESLERRLQELEDFKKAFQSVKVNQIARTCHELKASDPSLPSGMYYIDPDGQNVGDNPIYVYCDMSTGTTSVPHDTETKTEVSHCADPGCYYKDITYTNVTIRQMTVLAELSTECHQSIRYDCNYAPFEANGVPYSWWNDRDGIARYFWAGNNSNIHTCQCGIDGHCVDSLTKCNCDALAPVNLVDEGVITDKNLLPVTRLNFGRTQLSSSSGAHTLGRFTCSGQIILSGKPSSCSDLSMVGHTLSGFYSVKGKTSQQLETIYCNFNKMESESDYETRIGISELKSSPTYFLVKRNQSTAENATGTVTFQVEQLNIGRAMNLTSGVYTAPQSGTYYFAFSGTSRSLSSGESKMGVALTTNHQQNLGYTIFCGSLAAGNIFSSASIEVTAHLTAGEQVSLTITDAISIFLYNTQFTGWQLQQDLLL